MELNYIILQKALKQYAIRYGRGWQKELEGLSGVHSSTIGRTLKGETTPTMDIWTALHRAAPAQIPPPVEITDTVNDVSHDYKGKLYRIKTRKAHNIPPVIVDRFPDIINTLSSAETLISHGNETLALQAIMAFASHHLKLLSNQESILQNGNTTMESQPKNRITDKRNEPG
jgi:hypothetical protein